jgi:malate dehydrogenase (oxaloacetate-decarboxylating)
VSQIVSGTISIAPLGHSATQIPAALAEVAVVLADEPAGHSGGRRSIEDGGKPAGGSVRTRMAHPGARGRLGAVGTSAPHLSASFSATLRVHLENQPGSFARLAQAVGEAGGLLGAIDLVRVEKGKKVRDVTVLAADEGHIARIVEAVSALEGIEVDHVSDRTFLLHLGGKLAVVSKVPLKTRDDLSMAYTPGVARVCRAIADDPEKVWNLTIKQNAVAVVTDGTAVLGLGDIGPEAALPVMEGKAILFKEFAGIDAWPVCLSTTDPDEIVRTVSAIAPVFGGINLEDISAPRCFEIEARLRSELEIPVFHDDQHGTAIVVLAALLNALRVVGKRLEDARIVVTGAGAAGAATARTLLAAGAAEVVCCDRRGVLDPGRAGLDPFKAALAAETNGRGLRGSADEALAGADVYIGLSGPGAVSVEGIRSMAGGAIVFAMANPTPEIAPEEVEDIVAVIGTGRSDYPNQINNVLAFPGVFRGALDVRATTITKEMEIAAAHALAAVVEAEHVEADYVIPSVFDQRVAPAVAAAVARAAEASGVARRQRTAAAAVA